MLLDLRRRANGFAACAVVVSVLACRASRTNVRAPGASPVTHRSGDVRGLAPAAPRCPRGDALIRSDLQAAVDEELAGSDPLAFLQRCRTEYLERVCDYRCLFTKQELLRGGLTEVQKIKVAFREQPYSVDMQWVAHPGRARRVTYVAKRWSKDGRQRARIELNGLAGLVFPGGIKLDIHGPMMSAESRSSIDRFGFKRTLDAIIETCERFQKEPGYRLVYRGMALLADRPCYLFERHLPSRRLQPARNVRKKGCYKHSLKEGASSKSGASRRLKPAAQGSGDDRYPDRLLLIYIDREWLVPSGCFAYSDDARKQLLGSYVLTDVAFNVGLTDAEF